MMERDFTRDSDPITSLVMKTFGRVSFGFEIEARDEECVAGINGPVTLSSARTGGCHPQTKTGNSRMIFYLRRDLGPVIMGGDDIILTMEYYIAITEDRCHRDQAQENHPRTLFIFMISSPASNGSELSGDVTSVTTMTPL